MNPLNRAAPDTLKRARILQGHSAGGSRLKSQSAARLHNLASRAHAQGNRMIRVQRNITANENAKRHTSPAKYKRLRLVFLRARSISASEGWSEIDTLPSPVHEIASTLPDALQSHNPVKWKRCVGGSGIPRIGSAETGLNDQVLGDS